MYVSAISRRLLRGRSTPAMRAMPRPPYPWRCLWRGFVQSTRTTPARRMTLQFLQIGLTDARTFMPSLRPCRDAPLREIARPELDRHPVPRRDPHAAGRGGGDLMPVVEADLEPRVRAETSDGAARGDRVSLHLMPLLQGKLKIYGPSAVTATECSKWAERHPSRVAAVQPSSFT